MAKAKSTGAASHGVRKRTWPRGSFFQPKRWHKQDWKWLKCPTHQWFLGVCWCLLNTIKACSLFVSLLWLLTPFFGLLFFYCIITRIQYISSQRLLIRTVVLYGTTLLLTAQLTFFCTLAHYKSCFLLTSPKYTHLLSTLIFFKTSTTNI